MVEVIIAMGIAAFCLIAMLGLIPMGLKQVKISSEQTAATAILASVVDDIRNTPPGTTATNSLTYEISIPAQGSSNIPSVLYLKEDGTKNPNNEYPARYALTASLVSSNNVSALTSGSLVIWWPAKAPRAKALGSVEAVVSFNRN